MKDWILTSSVIILIIMALRGLLKGKISLKLQYSLWALVLIRLLLPFSIAESVISVSNLFSTPSFHQADTAVIAYNQSYETVLKQYDLETEVPPPQELEQLVQQDLYERTYTQLQQTYQQAGTTVAESQLQSETQKQVKTIHLTATLTKLLPYLWVGGMVLTAAVLLTNNLHFDRKLRKNRTPLTIPGFALPVFQTTCVATPCLFGLWTPTVYLTDEVAEDSQIRDHVLAHEWSHYQQRDHIWSVLRCLCLVLHWYNPLVWWAAILSKRDAELACDARTIAALGEDNRTAYGKTLISMTCVQQDPKSLMLTATTMQSTKKVLKERILLIAKKPKTALYTLIACIVVAAVAVGCTFTGASDPQDQQDVPNTGEIQDNAEQILDKDPEQDLAELSQDELMEPCLKALDYIHALQHYMILERVTYTQEPGQEIPAYHTARYIHSGDDWYQYLQSEDEEYHFLHMNDRKFRKNSTPFEDNPFAEWTEYDFTGEELNSCWIKNFHYNEDGSMYLLLDSGKTIDFTVRAVTVEKETNRDRITLYLDTINDSEKPTSYQVTFRFDAETGAIAGINRTVQTDDTTVTNELTINTITQESAETALLEFWYAATGEEPPTDSDDNSDDSTTEIPDKENPLEILDLIGLPNGTSRPQDYYSFIYDPANTSLPTYFLETANVTLSDIQDQLAPNFLFTLRSDGTLYRIGHEPVRGFTFTQRYLFYVTDRNMIYLTDLTGQQELELYRGEERIQPRSLGYFNQNLYFVEGDYIRNLDLTTGFVGTVFRYKGATLAEPLINIMDKYPHLLYIIAGNKSIACNLLTGETAELKSQEEYERFATQGIWPTEPELTVEYFTQLLSPQTGYWYHRIMGCVFEKLSEISLEHMFYTGMELIHDSNEPTPLMQQRQYSDSFTGTEIAYLMKLSEERSGDPVNWSNAHKLPRKRVENILNTCLGISLSDATIPDSWDYFAGTDAYYDIVWDSYSVTKVAVTDVEVDSDGTIHVYWQTDIIADARSGEIEFLRNPNLILSMRRNKDGSFRILSNVLQNN